MVKSSPESPIANSSHLSLFYWVCAEGLSKVAYDGILSAKPNKWRTVIYKLEA